MAARRFNPRGMTEKAIAVSRGYELAADDLLVCRNKALDDSAAANLAPPRRLKTV